MTDLADAAAVRRWAATQARNMSVATMRAFRLETGHGISRSGVIEIISGTRMKPTVADFETLPTCLPTDASVRAETHVHLLSLTEQATRPGDLGRFVREFTMLRNLVDVERLADAWRAAIQRVDDLGATALSVAGDVDVDDLGDLDELSFDDALATRDRVTIAQWGRCAQQAAQYARLDLLLARGLEDAVDDALVRMADVG